MNIRVVDVAESKLMTLQQAFMRDGVYIILETIGLIVLLFNTLGLVHFRAEEGAIVTSVLNWLGIAWFLLEIITMLTNGKRRAFHDFMARSVVIKEEYWNNRHDR